ncbi:MAG TPA: site-specific DNA-methyltransferase, partial [Polyangia bacterium]|nr:site-specific DNA-methyltransferase [Polyangia bacterium]
MTLDLRQVHVGDFRDLLRQMPDESVNCVVTSVPYWSLRSYLPGDHPDKPKEIGLEETPAAWAAQLVEVFREVRRVLRSDGTCWVNCGDAYAGAAGGGTGLNSWLAKKSVTKSGARFVKEKRAPGLKPKDLIGLPWTLAFALRDDGWWLRAENIWHKINPLPESVEDRPCRDHEQVFLLTKSAEYFYDAQAVKQPASGGAHARASARRQRDGAGVSPKSAEPGQGNRANSSFHAAVTKLVDDRNLRTVWTITGEHYSGAHFATFPKKLVEPCILAGCPAGGVVLDPFGGSGTVGEVAEALGRNWILFDLNPEYAELARQR